MKLIKLIKCTYAGTTYYDGFYREDPTNKDTGIWFHHHFSELNKLNTTLGYESDYSTFKVYINKYSINT